MFKKTNILILILIILFFSEINLAISATEPVTDEMRDKSEEVIRQTFRAHLTLLELKDAFETQLKAEKKPKLWSSKASKEFYSQRHVYRQAFQSQVDEFSEFMLTIDKIRCTTDAKKLQSYCMELSSNTTRFVHGLKGFVVWSLNGEAGKDFDIIYKDRISEAAKKIIDGGNELSYDIVRLSDWQ